MRGIDSVNFYITSLCNYHCDNCCAGTVAKKSITPEEVASVRPMLNGIDQLIITGGEPTLHKKFREVMEEVVKINYKKLILATNGYGLMKHIDLLDHFNEIRISYYNQHSYSQADDNWHLIEEIKKKYKGKARIVHQHIKMQANNGKSGICGRGKNTVASYFMGKIYGCCVGAGIYGAEGKEIGENWRKDAEKLPLPCNKCPFAV